MTIFVHRITGNLAAGDVWNCTVHSQSDLGVSPVHASFVTAATALLDAIAPLWNPNTASADLVTTQLDPSNQFGVAQESTPTAIVGTGAGGPTAQGTCIVLSWVTQLPRRQGRGRIFLPGLDDSHVTTAGLWASAACTTLKNAGTTFLADMAPNTTPVLYNRKSTVATTITAARVNTKPSFQRRRNNKVDNVYL